jgi:predicted transposase/invertase (TIGR01784 family)
MNDLEKATKEDNHNKATQKHRYLDLLTDYGFKKVFLNHDILIHFLNAFLAKEGIVITELKYQNTEQLGQNIDDRKAVFDMLCKTSTGEYILIELQKARQKYFNDRKLYYSSFLIQKQAKKGRWNYGLQRVFVIGIQNFVTEENDSRYLSTKVFADAEGPKCCPCFNSHN